MSDQAIRDYFAKAISNHKSGNLQSAEHFYRKVLSLHPTHPDANHNMGRIAIWLNKVPEAVDFFKVSVKSKPKTIQYWKSLIDAYIDQMSLEEAKSALRKANEELDNPDEFEYINDVLKINDDLLQQSVPERVAHIQYLVSKQQHAEVIKMAEALLLIDQSATTFNQLAFSLIQIGNTKRANEILRKGVLKNPNHYELNLNYGVILIETQKLDLGIKHLKIAFSKNSDEFDVNFNLANAYIIRRDALEADIHCKKAELANPNDQRLPYLRARLLHLKNEGRHALAELELCKKSLLGNTDIERAMLAGYEIFKRAEQLNLIDDMEAFKNLTIDRRRQHFPIIGNIQPPENLHVSLRNLCEKPLSSTFDARYGVGHCTSSFNLFDSDNADVGKIGDALISYCEKLLDGKIVQLESFCNIMGAGGGTTPHAHLGPQDICFNQGLYKYSLTYYVDVGDQNCDEPGVLKFYKPDFEYLPNNGDVVVFPSTVYHSAVYGGARERIMIGMNFYLC